MLDRGIFIPHLLRPCFGLGKGLIQAAGDVKLICLTAAADLWQFFNDGLQIADKRADVLPHLGDKIADQPFFCIQKSKSKMCLLHLLVAVLRGYGLRVL